MKVVIAGSRDIIDYDVVCQAIKESGFDISLVISGGARGTDRLGERWARENKIPCEVMTADWDRGGKSAGLRRNKEMAETGDALIAVWDGKSRGTEHMINMAKLMKLQVYVKKVSVTDDRGRQTL